MFLKLILSMQLLAYETIEHHALLSRDNACPKSHVLVNELSESFTKNHYQLNILAKAWFGLSLCLAWFRLN